MANFPTHLAYGTLVSGGLATLTLAANVVGPESLIAVATAGVVGSVLPDIDLKDSRPGKAMFFGLASFFSFVSLFLLAGKLSIAELWITAAATFAFVLYVVHAIFHRMSYHRGIFHSILAAVFFALVTAITYYFLLRRQAGVAWLAGGFMFIGYLVHLTLDEIYSVDVADRRIKASFGTALKLWDGKHPGHSIAMAVCTVAAFLLAPPTQQFVDGITSPALWTGLKERMLPRDKWFGIVDQTALMKRFAPSGVANEATPSANPVVRIDGVPDGANRITTGTLREHGATPPAQVLPQGFGTKKIP
ncbi:MAG: metal-dependent hydrolase [Hyphomicrobiaceae bacterium]